MHVLEGGWARMSAVKTLCHNVSTAPKTPFHPRVEPLQPPLRPLWSLLDKKGLFACPLSSVCVLLS